MNARRDTPFTLWNRRQFLRASGLSVAGGTLLAACGGGAAENGIPRVGEVPSTTLQPKVPVTDLALLRTATSLEYSALYVYEAVAGLGLLDADQSAIAARFADDHGAHATAFATLSTSLGGEAFNCPNPRIQAVYVEPALRLILGTEAASELGIEAGATELEPSEDQLTDVLILADALESLAAATYQSFVEMVNDHSLRTELLRIGAQEAQHAALLGALINPTTLINIDAVALPTNVNPTTTTTAPPTGLPTTTAAPDTTEAPVAAPTATLVYAVPSTYGVQSPIQIQLGAPNESGIRTTVSLETPRENSMVYEYQGACDN